MRIPKRYFYFTTLVVTTLAIGIACSDDDSEGDDTGTTDTDTDSDTDSDTDTDTDTDTDSDTGPATECYDGLPFREWDDTASEAAYDQISPDMVINTTAGEFILSDGWNGCENFAFAMYHTGDTTFWGTGIGKLITESAPNTHFLFLSLEADASAAELEARVREIEDKVNDYLDGQDQDVQDYWADRFHYVLDYGRDLPVVDAVLSTSSGERHFTIDRHQLIREGHNIATNSGSSWIDQLSAIRYWSRYYNGQYLLNRQLRDQELTEDVLVRQVADKEDIVGNVPFNWVLPSAKAIAEYERLEIDMRVDCPGAGHPYGSTCGEWDTVGSLWLCGDDKCTDENRRRIVKWITPYSSPGRWLIDITPELVYLADGGQLLFMTTHGDNDVGQYTYKYTVELRFSHSEDGTKPFAIDTLIPRGNYAFDTMADAFDPFDIVPPDDALKVELYTRISGHGSVTPSNCAEFCTFEHTFDVNGDDYQHIYLMEPFHRCQERVELGVTPCQGGTWWYDRSSWCPGWVIEEWREDITSSILGGTNTINHIPTYGGDDPPGGNMDARVEVVYYK